MEISVVHQLFEIAAAAVVGLCAGLLYDIFRVFRAYFKARLVTDALDLLYWIICGLCLFLMGLSIGNGQQRIAAIMVGAISSGIYFWLLSPFALKIFFLGAHLCEKIAEISLIPLRFLLNSLKKIVKKLKTIFHYNKKWYKIERQYVKRTVKPDSNDGGCINEEKAPRYSYENIADRSADLHGHIPYNNERENKGGRRRA